MSLDEEMIFTKSRSVTVAIIYQNKDVTTDIAPYLTAFTFTDNSTDNSDDISFTLQDRKGLWLDDWFPAKGDKVRCSIVLDDTKAQSLPCGLYEVDQIDYSAPPKTITIKAVSTAITKGMKSEKHSRAWEDTGIRTIAGDIANSNGLALYFDAEDVQIGRREQISTSDIEFLSGICRDYDLAVKVNEGKLIIYDEELNEDKESVAILDVTDPKIISWRFSTKAANVYKKAVIKYHNAAKDETFTAEENDDSVEGSERVLYVHQFTESLKDAKKKAHKKLKKANQAEVNGSITMMGDIRFRAGVNISVTGFGKFSGKFTVSKATHTVGNGYTTTLELTQGSTAKKASNARKKKKQSKGGGELYYTGDRYYGNDKSGG